MRTSRMKGQLDEKDIEFEMADLIAEKAKSGGKIKVIGYNE